MQLFSLNLTSYSGVKVIVIGHGIKLSFGVGIRAMVIASKSANIWRFVPESKFEIAPLTAFVLDAVKKFMPIFFMTNSVNKSSNFTS